MNLKATLLTVIILICLFTMMISVADKRVKIALGDHFKLIDTEQKTTNELLKQQIELLKKTNERYDSLTQESIDQTTAKKKWNVNRAGVLDDEKR
jgi:hypothetical protein